MKPGQRQSNIELARIVCMISIVLTHFFGQSDLIYEKNFITEFISLGARISTSIFIMISCYFSQKSSVTCNKIFNIWSTMFFYNIIGTAFALAVGNNISMLDLVSAALPFFRKMPWFGSAYISFLLLLPFLQKINTLPDKQHFLLVVVLLILCPVQCTFSTMMDTYLDHMVWFVVCFVVLGYIQKAKPEITGIRKRTVVLLAFVGILVYSSLIYLRTSEGLVGRVSAVCLGYVFDMKSIPNILVSFCMFVVFLNLDIGVRPAINAIARLTFPVYCLHQAQNIFPSIWNTYLNTGVRNFPLPIILLMLIIGLFAVTACLEFVRRFLYRKAIEIGFVKKAFEQIDSYLLSMR